MKTVSIKCPCCSTEFEAEINVGALLGSSKSEKKLSRLAESSKLPRPGAKGKSKPRIPKVDGEGNPIIGKKLGRPAKVQPVAE